MVANLHRCTYPLGGARTWNESVHRTVLGWEAWVQLFGQRLVGSSGLHVRATGAGPPAILLHGLFGSGANLGALARSLQDAYRVFSPDLPNHGRSAWLHEPDLPGMAAALRGWMDAEGLARVHLVGHSLGGKVAMQCALDEPARVAALVVADIAPVAYAARHDEVFAALAAVADGHCEDRAAAAGLMASYLGDEQVIGFLLASLQRTARGFMDWRFDLRGIRSAYPALLAAPGAGSSYPGPTLFIKGGESDYILEDHRSAIAALFPAATVKVVAGCGHWLHAEKPELFSSIVRRFLDRTAAGTRGGERAAGADAS